MKKIHQKEEPLHLDIKKTNLFEQEDEIPDGYVVDTTGYDILVKWNDKIFIYAVNMIIFM